MVSGPFVSGIPYDKLRSLNTICVHISFFDWESAAFPRRIYDSIVLVRCKLVFHRSGANCSIIEIECIRTVTRLCEFKHVSVCIKYLSGDDCNKIITAPFQY